MESKPGCSEIPNRALGYLQPLQRLREQHNLAFRCPMALARAKLEQRRGRALAGALALPTDEASGEIVHERCWRPAQCAEIDIARVLHREHSISSHG
jgi:hypothetical protein